MPRQTYTSVSDRKRNTKIIATLGPASSEECILKRMLRAGMNVARINFSHGDHISNGALIDAVRKASAQTGIPVALLQDLGGPKIRIGDFTTDTVTLVPKKQFVLTTEKIQGSVERVSVNYKKLPMEVHKGANILLNDGKVQLCVLKTTPATVVCEVVVGGTIRGRRGVNVPGARLSVSAITPKDKKDLAFGLSQGVHFVTLSFVRYAHEVHTLRRLLGSHQKTVGIIAKIETQEAVDNLDEIVAAADAIMVARGDLAIEIPREQVPLVQKRIIRACNQAGKPVITATQMLDSMREHEVPTRAEVNDVANAILDGSDAIMLSDETTVGQFPVAAIETMNAIAQTVEKDGAAYRQREAYAHSGDTVAISIAAAVAHEAEALTATAVVALTETGKTARLIARHRIPQPILVLTPWPSTFFQSLLVYGCIPVLGPAIASLADALTVTRRELRRAGLATKGNRFVLGAGMPFRKSGSTNLMIVEEV